jgi:hypothetical protein
MGKNTKRFTSDLLLKVTRAARAVIFKQKTFAHKN